MFRKLLATTAMAGLLVGGALAQQATTPAPAEPVPVSPATTAPADAAAKPVVRAEGELASSIIGESVYNGSAENAEEIGDVNDMVLDKDGVVKSLIVGVGGFLGVGEKNVEVDYKTAEWAEKNGDRWIVVATTKDQLLALPAFDPAPYQPVAPVTTGSTTPVAPAAPDAMTPPSAAPAEQPKPAN